MDFKLFLNLLRVKDLLFTKPLYGSKKADFVKCLKIVLFPNPQYFPIPFIM
jgi:hypothetical protein